jgi:hypothetical protein
MQRKERFPPEADTQPDLHQAKVLTSRRSGMAPKNPHDQGEPPVRAADAAGHGPEGRLRRPSQRLRRDAQPPGAAAPAADDTRPSGLRSRRGARRDPAAATVDEVVADLSQDPRRERD